MFDIHRPGMKEMLANYGLAMMRASSVEKTLMLLIVAINRIGKHEVPPDEFHSVIYEDNKKTFGQLLSKLKSKITISPDLEKEIVEAVKKRNFLAHDFFFQNGETLLNGDISPLSKNLQEIGDFIVGVHPKLDNLLEKFLEQWHIPLDDVDQEVKELLSKKSS